MGLLLYSTCFLFLMAATALYATRSRWLHLLPDELPEPFYSRLATYSAGNTSFMSDVESGLTSNAFDLSGNVMEGDSRAGLDVKGKQEVQRIMKRRGLGFDEARKVYMEQRFKKNNIGADGLPRDPKFVSFS